MIQGVREIFEIVDLEQNGSGDKVGSGGATGGKMVLIGRGMDEKMFGVSLVYQLDSSYGDNRERE